MSATAAGPGRQPGVTWRTMRLLLLMCDLELAAGTAGPDEVADYLEPLLVGWFLPVARA